MFHGTHLRNVVSDAVMVVGGSANGGPTKGTQNTLVSGTLSTVVLVKKYSFVYLYLQRQVSIYCQTFGQ